MIKPIYTWTNTFIRTGWKVVRRVRQHSEKKFLFDEQADGLHLENLEDRQMLAGDLDFGENYDSDLDQPPSMYSSSNSPDYGYENQETSPPSSTGNPHSETDPSTSSNYNQHPDYTNPTSESGGYDSGTGHTDSASSTASQHPTGDPSTGGPSLSGLGELSAPDSLTGGFSLPNLAGWPDAPDVYQPNLPDLESKPNGTEEESLPDDFNYPPVPQSVQNQINQKYNNDVSSANEDHDRSTNQADNKYSSDLASAKATHDQMVASAAATRDAAVNGFAGSDIESLQNAAEDARTAYHNEVQAVKDREDAWLSNRIWEIEEERANKNQAAQEAFERAEEQIYREFEESYGVEEYELDYEDMEDNEAAVEERNRRLSAAREIRDNAFTDNNAAATVATAAATKASKDRVIDAGISQLQALRSAEYTLLLANISDTYSFKKVKTLADQHYWRSMGEASEFLQKKTIEFEAAKKRAYANADAEKQRALVRANSDREVASSEAYHAHIVGLVGAQNTEVKKYEVKKASAELKSARDASEANLTNQLANINSYLTVSLAIIDSEETNDKKESEEQTFVSGELSRVAGEFKTELYNQLEMDEGKNAENEKNAEANSDTSKRTLDKGLAEVNKKRTTRTANELKQNTKDRQKAENLRSYGLITASAYNSRIATLNQQRMEIQKQIATETFGNPGEANSSLGATESGVRTEWVNQRNSANELLNKQRAEIKAANTKKTADLVDQKTAEANAARRRQETESLKARAEAQAEIREELETWIRKVATASATLRSSLASISATLAIDIAKASSEFYTQAAIDYAQKIRTFANDQQSKNPWANREATTAEAKAERTTKAGQSYVELVTTTAFTAAQTISDLAAAKTQSTISQIIAGMNANESIWAAIETVQNDTSAAQEEHHNSITKAQNDSNRILADSEKIFTEKATLAAVNRTEAFFGAALLRHFMAISNPVGSTIETFNEGEVGAIVSGNIVARYLEGAAGGEYGHRMVSAMETLNQTIVDQRQTLHKRLATARETAQLANIDINETYLKDIKSAQAKHAKAQLEANGIFADTMLTEVSEQQRTGAAADEAFRIAEAEADKEFSIALAEAEIDFELEVIKRNLEAVSTWRNNQRDDQGRIKSEASYSLEVHKAFAKWHELAGPEKLAHARKISQQVYDVTTATASVTKESLIDQSRASEDYSRSIQLQSVSLGKRLADLGLTRSHEFVSATAILDRSIASSAKQFAGSFATRRFNFEKIVVTESAKSENDKVDVLVEHYKYIINDAEKNSQIKDISDALGDKLFAAQVVFANSLANATDTWGDDQSNAIYGEFVSIADAAKSHLNNVTAKNQEVQKAVTEALTARDKALALSRMTNANTANSAIRDFRIGISSAHATVSIKLSEIEIDYTESVAKAEAEHHIEVAQRNFDDASVQYGATPTDSEQIDLDLKSARLKYLQAVSEEYVSVRKEIAQHEATAFEAHTNAHHDLLETEAREYHRFQEEAETQLKNRLSQYADYSATVENAWTDDFKTWTDATIGADHKKQTDMAEAFRQAAQVYISAETTHYRGRANIRPESSGNELHPGYGGDSSNLDAINKAYSDSIAEYRFIVDKAKAKTDRDHALAISSSKLTHVKDIARAHHSVGHSSANDYLAFANAMDQAELGYKLKLSEALEKFEKTNAKAEKDQIIADSQSLADAVKVQYLEAKNIYHELWQKRTDNYDARQAWAYAKGAHTYIHELAPDYVQAQTDRAESIYNARVDIAGEIRTFKDASANALKSGRAKVNEKIKNGSMARWDAWKTAVIGEATAQKEYDDSVANAEFEFANSKAILVKAARIAKGYSTVKNPYGIQYDISSAQQQKQNAIQAANNKRNNDLNSTKTTHAETIRSLNRSLVKDTASYEKERADKVANARAEGRKQIETIVFDAQKILIDVQHDLKIDDLRAYIEGLESMYNGFTSNANLTRLQQARHTRQEKTDQINQDRSNAHQSNETAKAAAVTKIEADQKKELDDAEDRFDSQNDLANASFSTSVANFNINNYKLPKIEQYTVQNLGVTASTHHYVHLSDPHTLVSRVTKDNTFGGSSPVLGANAYAIDGEGGHSFSPFAINVPGGLFEGTGRSAVVDMIRFVIPTRASWIESSIINSISGNFIGDYLVNRYNAEKQAFSDYMHFAQENAAYISSFGQSYASFLKYIDKNTNFFTDMYFGSVEDQQRYESFGIIADIFFSLEFVKSVLVDIQGSISTGASGFVGAVFGNPLGTIQALGNSALDHYDKGGALGLLGMITGTTGLYESYTGVDFLTGRTLSGDERFDRAWMGTAGLLTSVGGSAILRNMAVHGVRAGLQVSIQNAASAPSRFMGYMKGLKGRLFKGTDCFVAGTLVSTSEGLHHYNVQLASQNHSGIPTTRSLSQNDWAILLTSLAGVYLAAYQLGKRTKKEEKKNPFRFDEFSEDSEFDKFVFA